MPYLDRLEAMTDALTRHPLVEVLESRLGPSRRGVPGLGKRLEDHIRTYRVKGKPALQKARRDPAFRAFYEEVESFALTWRLRLDRLDPVKHAWALGLEDGDRTTEGHILLLPEDTVLDTQEHLIWLPEDPPDDPLRAIHPFDRPTLSHRVTVIVPNGNGVQMASYLPASRHLGAARLSFDAWFERLLATRGLLDTLWSTPDSADFARLRSVFDDVDPALFA